jgi:hypothetical protein
MVGLQHVADVLGVGAISATREADQVDEKDRYKLPLLLGRFGFHGRAARQAEACPFRILLAAACTAHAGSLPRRLARNRCPKAARPMSIGPDGSLSR